MWNFLRKLTSTKILLYIGDIPSQCSTGPPQNKAKRGQNSFAFFCRSHSWSWHLSASCPIHLCMRFLVSCLVYGAGSLIFIDVLLFMGVWWIFTAKWGNESEGGLSHHDTAVTIHFQIFEAIQPFCFEASSLASVAYTFVVQAQYLLKCNFSMNILSDISPLLLFILNTLIWLTQATWIELCRATFMKIILIHILKKIHRFVRIWKTLQMNHVA